MGAVIPLFKTPPLISAADELAGDMATADKSILTQALGWLEARHEVVTRYKEPLNNAERTVLIRFLAQTKDLS